MGDIKDSTTNMLVSIFYQHKIQIYISLCVGIVYYLCEENIMRAGAWTLLTLCLLGLLKEVYTFAKKTIQTKNKESLEKSKTETNFRQDTYERVENLLSQMFMMQTLDVFKELVHSGQPLKIGAEKKEHLIFFESTQAKNSQLFDYDERSMLSYVKISPKRLPYVQEFMREHSADYITYTSIKENAEGYDSNNSENSNLHYSNCRQQDIVDAYYQIQKEAREKEKNEMDATLIALGHKDYSHLPKKQQAIMRFANDMYILMRFPLLPKEKLKGLHPIRGLLRIILDLFLSCIQLCIISLMIIAFSTFSKRYFPVFYTHAAAILQFCTDTIPAGGGKFVDWILFLMCSIIIWVVCGVVRAVKIEIENMKDVGVLTALVALVVTLLTTKGN